MQSEYKHCDTSDACLSLHDCVASKVSLENGVLSFYFDNGIWICPTHETNDSGEVVRSDAARVDWFLQDLSEPSITVYVFTEKRFRRAIRKEWSLEKLLDAINSEKCSLEFLYRYKDDNEEIISCVLGFRKRPFSKECQIQIAFSRVEYRWNDLCKDKVW